MKKIKINNLKIKILLSVVVLGTLSPLISLLPGDSNGDTIGEYEETFAIEAGYPTYKIDDYTVTNSEFAYHFNSIFNEFFIQNPTYLNGAGVDSKADFMNSVPDEYLDSREDTSVDDGYTWFSVFIQLTMEDIFIKHYNLGHEDEYLESINYDSLVENTLLTLDAIASTAYNEGYEYTDWILYKYGTTDNSQIEQIIFDKLLAESLEELIKSDIEVSDEDMYEEYKNFSYYYDNYSYEYVSISPLDVYLDVYEFGQLDIDKYDAEDYQAIVDDVDLFMSLVDTKTISIHNIISSNPRYSDVLYLENIINTMTIKTHNGNLSDAPDIFIEELTLASEGDVLILSESGISYIVDYHGREKSTDKLLNVDHYYVSNQASEYDIAAFTNMPDEDDVSNLFSLLHESNTALKTYSNIYFYDLPSMLHANISQSSGLHRFETSTGYHIVDIDETEYLYYEESMKRAIRETIFYNNTVTSFVGSEIYLEYD